MPPPLHAAAPYGIAFRPMVDADLPFIEALFASTRAEEVALTGWPEEQQRAFLAQQHRAQHHHYRNHYPDAEWLIVERGREPIGRLYLDRSERLLHIIDLSLVPAARGQGLGGAILGDIIGAAHLESLDVSLHVERHNPAIRLYLRLGFNCVGEEGLYLEMLLRTGKAPPASP